MCFDLLRLRGLGYSSADFWLDASSGCYRAGGAGAVGGTGSGGAGVQWRGGRLNMATAFAA